jgi:peptidoglycan/LPS O-acetylase OafA/YrhL
MSKSRVQFLDDLRGFSACAVLFYHFYIFFYTAQYTVSGTCFFPPLELKNILPLTGSFDLGRFAVIQFFLMSGFFLPDLVERYSKRSHFLKNRFFRLFPTYAVAFFASVGCIALGAWYQGIPFPFDAQMIFNALFAVEDWMGAPPMMGVNWTFSIEIKFAFWCLFLWRFLVSSKPIMISILTAVFMGGMVILNNLWQESFLEIPDLIVTALIPIVKNMAFFQLIFLGTFLRWFSEKKISLERFLGGFFLSLCSFFLFLPVFYSGALLSMNYLSCPLGILFFLGVLVLKEKLWFVFKGFFAWVSKISYSLYLFHALPCWIVAYIVYDIFGGVFREWVVWATFVVLTPVIFLVAYCFNKWIEGPTRRLGQKSMKNEKVFNQ